MQVQVIHQQANGSTTPMGVMELDHMPPIGEPFPIDNEIYYMAKAYFGPDHNGQYQLVLEGDPKPVNGH